MVGKKNKHLSHLVMNPMIESNRLGCYPIKDHVITIPICELFGSEHWYQNPPLTHHEIHQLICAFLRAFHGLLQPTDSWVLWVFFHQLIRWLVYLPTWMVHFMVNVGRYSIRGSYPHLFESNFLVVKKVATSNAKGCQPLVRFVLRNSESGSQMLQVWNIYLHLP